MHGIDTNAIAFFAQDAARLSKINVTRQLADDHQIQPGDNFRFERRGIGQFRKNNCRSQIREKIALFAQAKNGLFGPMFAWQRIVFWPADRTKQYRIGVLRKLQGRGGQWMPMLVVGRTADHRRFCFDFQTVATQYLEHLECLGHNFGADAIASHDCNFHTSHLIKKPRLVERPRRLIGFDLVALPHRAADFIPAIEQ